MEQILSVALVITVFVTLLAWKAFSWVWLNPKKIERYLRSQGIDGSSYKFLRGDTKENAGAAIKARSKPMELSHRIGPRVIPFFHQMVAKYGKMSFIWIGTTARVIIMDPNMIKDVLSSKSDHFGKAKSFPLGRLLSSGVVSYEGEKWAKHRRILNPAFHLEKLKMMLSAFYASSNEMVNKWKTLVQEESCELDVWPYLQKMTADVISRTAFGSSYEEGRQIFQLLREQAELIIQASQSIYVPGFRFVPTKRHCTMKKIHRTIHTLVRDLIYKREKAMETGDAPNDDLLGLLMESNSKEIKDMGNSKNSGITIDEVIEECKLFYFAGQETTSSLLVWTMIVLSMHPEWQDKAREEVFDIFGKSKPDFDGLNRMKIVTMILYEVLRLYSPLTILTRATIKETKLGDVILPQGVEIAMPALLVHHDYEFWGKDAEEFNPERFDGGVSKATKTQVSYFPFGWGPRICIGQTFALIEAKMAITMILQHFSFELSSTYAHAPCTVVTLQPQHGAQLILHKV